MRMLSECENEFVPLFLLNGFLTHVRLEFVIPKQQLVFFGKFFDSGNQAERITQVDTKYAVKHADKKENAKFSENHISASKI